MEYLILIALVVFLFIIIKSTSYWIRFRIKMILAMIGVTYKISDSLVFIISAVIFYVVYGVIFSK